MIHTYTLTIESDDPRLDADAVVADAVYGIGEGAETRQALTIRVIESSSDRLIHEWISDDDDAVTRWVPVAK